MISCIAWASCLQVSVFRFWADWRSLKHVLDVVTNFARQIRIAGYLSIEFA